MSSKSSGQCGGYGETLLLRVLIPCAVCLAHNVGVNTANQGESRCSSIRLGADGPNSKDRVVYRSCDRAASTAIRSNDECSYIWGAPPNDMRGNLGRLSVELGIILALSLIALYALRITDQRESSSHLATVGVILAAIRIFRIYLA